MNVRRDCLLCGTPIGAGHPDDTRACSVPHEIQIRECEEALALQAAANGKLQAIDGRAVYDSGDGPPMDLTDAVDRLIGDGRLTAGWTVTDRGEKWLAEVPS